MTRTQLLLFSAGMFVSCGAAAQTPPPDNPDARPLEFKPQVAEATYTWGHGFVASACVYLKAAAAQAAETGDPAAPEVVRWQEACPASDEVDPKALADRDPVHTARGLLAEACVKFEAARLSTKPTTSLTTYLALCAEQAGLKAKALKLFLEARRLKEKISNERTRQDFEQQIGSAIERVKKQVAWLVISVEPRPKRLQVLLDNVEVPLSDLGREIPVEPGQRQIWARAHAYDDQRLTLPTVANQHHTARLELQAQNPYIKPVAKGVGVAGLAAVGVAAYFGYRTLKLVSDSNRYCDEQNVCTHQGADLRDRALTAQARGFGFAAGGLVAIGGSAIVYYTW